MEPRKILVPVNGDGADEEAVRFACSLAKRHKATVYALYVVEVERSLPLEAPPPSDIEYGDAVLQRMERIAKEEKYVIEAEILQAREAGPAVVEEAIQRQVDIILMGLAYKKHRGEFNLGTTVPYVLMRAPCKVLVSRDPPDGMTAEPLE